MPKEINYVIGRYYDEDETEIETYMFCGTEVHFGTIEDAKERLDYLTKTSKDQGLQIFKLVELEEGEV